jgi:hypothetical protein
MLGIVTICGFPVFVIGVVLVIALIPGRFETTWTYAPNSGAYRVAVVTARGTIARGEDFANTSTIQLTLIPNRGHGVSRQFRFGEDDTALPDAGAILALLQTLDIDVSDPLRMREAQELSTQIQHAAWGTYTPSPDLRTLRLVD